MEGSQSTSSVGRLGMLIRVVALSMATLATIGVAGVAAGAPASDVPVAAQLQPNANDPCAVTPIKAYWVEGTLVSLSADDPATGGFEGAVTVIVTDANRHARDSGELADQDASEPGVQVEGSAYTVSGDPYVLTLRQYESPDTPSAGDPVRISGTIPLVDADCTAAGTSLADRYGSPDIAEVTITDADLDA